MRVLLLLVFSTARLRSISHFAVRTIANAVKEREREREIESGANTKERGPNSKSDEEDDNQRRSNGRLHSQQPETDDSPSTPFITVVNEADSFYRKFDALETLNPKVDRDLDGARSSVAVAPCADAVTIGFHQGTFQRHHRQDGASTSSSGLDSYLGKVQHGKNASGGRGDEAGFEGIKREMEDLEELLSKLNPMAEEFVPSSLAGYGNGGGWRYSNAFGFQNGNAEANAGRSNRKKSSYVQEKRRMNSRTNLAQRGEVIRRTVYVSDIDLQVTEEQLATLFISCGQVVDCRICGDPNSVLRFAFIEFTDEEGARAALGLSGTMLGFYPVRVLPSKTAIAPVNPTFLPRSEDEREMCARTVYCTNIDKKITQVDLKNFFESLCGEVYRLRLLGDHHYSNRIAFVEFVQADSATTALTYSGATLGTQPIRISPSKTPVRPRTPRYSGGLRV